MRADKNKQKALEAAKVSASDWKALLAFRPRCQ